MTTAGGDRADGTDGEGLLAAHLERIRQAPADHGTVELLVRRPAVDEREVLDEAQLDVASGLVGDSWSTRTSTRRPEGPDPDRQLTLVSARVMELLAGPRDRWPEAGDQLYVDLDLSEANLPPGSRLAIGDALIEITAQPHRGCAKFSRRFGPDAVRLVNSPIGCELRLRGVNARVVRGGAIRRGDTISKA
ncbi:MOSC domain-containing protein [Rhabdothermincola sp.]|uniref:MOSC domain-containing protein n=1 Tax=Rhabdothermincola sp. TaxID=2820405 RepID=UPI002FE01F3D